MHLLILAVCWRFLLSPGKLNHSLKKCSILMILCDSHYLLLYLSVAISEGRNRIILFLLALLEWKCCWMSGWANFWIFPSCKYNQLCEWNPGGSCVDWELETVSIYVRLSFIIPWYCQEQVQCSDVLDVKVRLWVSYGLGPKRSKLSHQEGMLGIALNFLFINEWRSMAC